MQKVPKKIVVVGTTGAGKTFLAKSLAQALGYAQIELDSVYWASDWQPVNSEVFLARTKALIEENSTWVVDGNYSAVRPFVWASADTLIWLDYNFNTILSRLILRTIKRVWTGEELWQGNRERLSKLCSGDSIILWFFKTYWRRKRDYAKYLAADEYAHLKQYRLTNPRQAEELLAELTQVAHNDNA